MPTFKDISFKFENFAGISTCDFSLSALSVLSGPNSVGKTYIVYAIYSFLKEMDELLQMPEQQLVQEVFSDGVASVDLAKFYKRVARPDRVASIFARMLPRWFSVSGDFFLGANIQVHLPDLDFSQVEISRQVQAGRGLLIDFSKGVGTEECRITVTGERDRTASLLISRVLRSVLVDIVLTPLKVEPFAITSERTGISLFWKELDINKNLLIDKLIESKGKKFDPWDLIEDQTSRYALPITDNIDLARDADNVAKQWSFIYESDELRSYVREPFDKMAQGRYRYSKEGIAFEQGRGKKKVNLPIYVASSSTKSLFLLDMFINHAASRNGLLVFDEPELNLHPANQRLMAQLIARLLSCGVNILMTTHSDFLLREINNRIALNADIPGAKEFAESVGISAGELIRPSEVLGLLLTKDRNLCRVSVGEMGLDMRSIDDAIVGATDLQSRVIDFLSRDEGGQDAGLA